MGIHNPLSRAVFLDRDGVLNAAITREGRPYSPQNIRELSILPGVSEALKKIKAMNFKTIVVTNQPDVARKLISQEVVEEIHRELTKKLCIDAFYVCWHDDKDECTCRKPRPGMLAQAAKDHGIDLCKSYMVGDRWRDVDAGAAVGCQTIFIDYGYQDQQPKKPDFISKSLAEAVVWIENDMEKYE